MIKKRCFYVAIIIALMICLPGCHMPNTVTIGCSVADLIDAINAANANVNDTTIRLAAGCTYTLTAADNVIGFGFISDGESQSNGLPAIGTHVYILGDAADMPTIERSTAAGTPEFRIFFVSYNGSLILKNLILQNGINAWAGGAIGVDHGTLRLEGVHLLYNSSPGGAPYANTVGGGGGGAIANIDGRVMITGSLLSENSALVGGAIENRGELIINTSILAENTADNAGGAVLNMSNLEMDDVWVIANTAGTRGGGGVFNRGTASFTNVDFQGNSSSTSSGGAIDNFGADFPGAVTISDCTFDENQAAFGGAVHSIGGTVTITTSRFESNSTLGQFHGGALYNSGYGGAVGLMTISSSTIENNSAQVAGGGIFNAGNMSIQNSTLSGNQAQDTGGGIYNGGTPDGDYGQLFMSGSTVIGNIAAQGAAMTNTTEAMVVNSTLSGNQGEWNGGFQNDGTSTIISSTIAYNTSVHGAGIYAVQGRIDIRNSIVAHNQYSNCSVNQGVINSDGANISDDGSCAGFSLTVNPLIMPLANNGGLTLTHALLPGSPAIDAVDAGDCVAATGSPLLVDQRGVTRPVGSQCDIGAFEFDPLAPPPTMMTIVPYLPAVQIDMPVNCRAGSSISFPALTILPQGQTIPLVAVNPSRTWYQVRPPDLEVACWVWGGAITPPEDLSTVPLVVDPATPTPFFSADVTEEPVGPILGCWVSRPSVGGSQCVYPCPPDAWPGGACTP